MRSQSAQDIVSDAMAAASSAKTLYESLVALCASVERLRDEVDYHDVGKGFRWEHEFQQMARLRGLSVCPRTDSKHDCVVNGKRVQCKRIDKDGGIICTTPVIGRMFLGYQLEDWDVLALKQMGRLLIIPAAAMLMDDGRRLINQIKPGEWGNWQDRWDVFGDGFCFAKEAQKTMFFFGQEATHGR